ncbi:hypothetical protein P167DRAFT_595316 [Morchella conica CCBAS932]|uniref:Uncharacterized protein n=1 Tax=Morchella conica CCBAS932 TaxID=1392247 RepID=A0A3N4KE18_9PEZI|nr:hypothetical protein P167DRAFT_595316 [Morchella conica CCBAS932]
MVLCVGGAVRIYSSSIRETRLSKRLCLLGTSGSINSYCNGQLMGHIISIIYYLVRWINPTILCVRCWGGHGKEGQPSRESLRGRASTYGILLPVVPLFLLRGFCRINRVGKPIRLGLPQRAGGSLSEPGAPHISSSPQAILLHEELKCLWLPLSSYDMTDNKGTLVDRFVSPWSGQNHIVPTHSGHVVPCVGSDGNICVAYVST